MSNVIRYLNGEDVFLNWEFFAEGLVELNSPTGGRGKVPIETFAKVLVSVASGPLRDGVVMLMESKNKKPLGFLVMLNCTPPFSHSIALVYALYTNGKCPTTVRELNKAGEVWARRYDFAEVQACSYRMIGSAIRWFKRQNFQPKCFIFSRRLA